MGKIGTDRRLAQLDQSLTRRCKLLHFNNKETPGPGRYEAPSDFGFRESMRETPDLNLTQIITKKKHTAFGHKGAKSIDLTASLQVTKKVHEILRA
jgi:hypothetical protein